MNFTIWDIWEARAVNDRKKSISLEYPNFEGMYVIFFIFSWAKEI